MEETAKFIFENFLAAQKYRGACFCAMDRQPGNEREVIVQAFEIAEKSGWYPNNTRAYFQEITLSILDEVINS